jgi:hypothetical protein
MSTTRRSRGKAIAKPIVNEQAKLAQKALSLAASASKCMRGGSSEDVTVLDADSLPLVDERFTLFDVPLGNEQPFHRLAIRWGDKDQIVRWLFFEKQTRFVYIVRFVVFFMMLCYCVVVFYFISCMLECLRRYLMVFHVGCCCYYSLLLFFIFVLVRHGRHGTDGTARTARPGGTARTDGTARTVGTNEQSERNFRLSSKRMLFTPSILGRGRCR